MPENIMYIGMACTVILFMSFVIWVIIKCWRES